MTQALESLNASETVATLENHSKLELRLLELLSKGALTRGEMVTKLGIPRSTIYDGLRGLIKRNEVEKYPLHAQERGRPKVLFALVEE